MSTDGQGTLWRRNIAENFNRLNRAHERHRRQTDDRQTTDGRTMTYSEHELEFTFAKNWRKSAVFNTITVALNKINKQHSTRYTDGVYKCAIMSSLTRNETFVP